MATKQTALEKSESDDVVYDDQEVYNTVRKEYYSTVSGTILRQHLFLLQSATIAWGQVFWRIYGRYYGWVCSRIITVAGDESMNRLSNHFYERCHKENVVKGRSTK